MIPLRSAPRSPRIPLRHDLAERVLNSPPFQDLDIDETARLRTVAVDGIDASAIGGQVDLHATVRDAQWATATTTFTWTITKGTA